MIYKQFQDMKLSALGFGTMRLPVLDGKDADVDEATTETMLALAMEKGINYYDTAWGYHEGNAELVIGKLLKKYPRDSFYLADKFPGYDLSNMPKVKEIFEQQLEKCQVEYFDFYLFHNLCELNLNQYLDPQYGIFDYLMEQKRNGRIRHLGVSVHGSYNTLKTFLEAYGEHMEFCQLQLNWLDWSFQDAKAKVELLREYNIPVWVMEPLRGGKLTNLAKEDEQTLRALRPDASAVDWSFRFLQSVPEVTVTLSGMSAPEQMADNLRIFETEQPLNDTEWQALQDVAANMLKQKTVPCTACRYCTTYCPKGLDIPGLLKIYNENTFTGGGFLAPMALAAMPKDKRPSACIGCRSCEAVCPQQIKISEALATFVRKKG